MKPDRLILKPSQRMSREPLRSRDLVWVKRGIWLYFWLLLFEGILRKWIFPEYSGPILLIRDAVLLFIYWKVYRSGKIFLPGAFPFTLVALCMITLACFQVAMSTNTVLIAAYGLRCYLMHLPLIMVIARTMDFEDVKKFGRWILIISVPMTALMMLQYYSSPNSWLNIGAGGSEGFAAARGLTVSGHARAAGTFSFSSGIECFVPCVVAFVLYAVTHTGAYRPVLVWSAAIASAVAIPISVSRTVWFMVAGVIAWTLLLGIGQVHYLLRFARVGAVVLVAGILLSQTSVFQDALKTAEDRWRGAAGAEGDLGDVIRLRVLGLFGDGLRASDSGDWLGKGIGMGSNVAAVLVTGTKGFMVAEGEWERVVLECGPLVGLLFLGLRVGLCGYLILQAFGAVKRGSVLSWFLIPTVVPTLLMTAMEQPTLLGFMAWGGGMCLAAARRRPPYALARGVRFSEESAGALANFRPVRGWSAGEPQRKLAEQRHRHGK